MLYRKHLSWNEKLCIISTMNRHFGYIALVFQASTCTQLILSTKNTIQCYTSIFPLISLDGVENVKKFLAKARGIGHKNNKIADGWWCGKNEKKKKSSSINLVNLHRILFMCTSTTYVYIPNSMYI